jgi:hypothetical protein
LEPIEPSSFEEHLSEVRSRYADCIFRSPVEAFGSDGALLLARWSEQLAEIDNLLRPHLRRGRSEDDLVEVATEPRLVLHYRFIGGEHWVEDWDGTVEDAQALLAGSVESYAARVRSALDQGWRPSGGR